MAKAFKPVAFDEMGDDSGGVAVAEPEARGEQMVPMSEVANLVAAQVKTQLREAGIQTPLTEEELQEPERMRVPDADVDEFLNKKPNLAKYYIVESARMIVRNYGLRMERWEQKEGMGRERVEHELCADFTRNPSLIGTDLQIKDVVTKQLRPVTIWACDLSVDPAAKVTKQDIIDLNLDLDPDDENLEGTIPIKLACRLMEKQDDYKMGLETRHPGRVWREDRYQMWLKHNYTQIRKQRADERTADSDWTNANPAQRAVAAF